MSFHLVVSVRFPTGRFSGASNRTAEWPPSPARLCAAVLSVAGLDGRAVVEELFAADPPTIDAPVGYPAIGASRWVPSQYSVACVNGELTPVRAGKERKDETLGRKESAPGQPSVHVGDASLTYTWTGLGHLATPLRPVVQQVPYLGRPTTPVVVTASATGNDPGPVESGRVRFVPDSNGDRRLDVASVDYLRSLDAVHDSRVQNRTIGFDQPVKTRRTAASRLSSCATRRSGSFPSASRPRPVPAAPAWSSPRPTPWPKEVSRRGSLNDFWPTHHCGRR